MSGLAPDAPWQEVLVMSIGVALIAGGVIAAIAGMVHEEKARRRQLRRPDMSVGRDVYREFTK